MNLAFTLLQELMSLCAFALRKSLVNNVDKRKLISRSRTHPGVEVRPLSLAWKHFSQAYAQVLEQLVQRQQAGAQAGGGGEDADFRMWDDQWQDRACPPTGRQPRCPV